MQDKYGWLIECRVAGYTMWWSGAFDTPQDRWAPWRPWSSDKDRLIARMVNDAGKAVRFARREDAQQALDGLLTARPSPLLQNAPEVYSVQEHLWPAPASKTPNVEFSGVPAGHSRNHPAGGTSAGTQG